jgi:Undecaprenyl-phosphate galactose phosphotransferase WbaP
MGAQTIIAAPTVKEAVRGQKLSLAWATCCCLIASDFIALSVVYWVAVLGRFAFHAQYRLSFYLELFPVIAIFLGVFATQDLYPGLLLHPAEELRRAFRSVTTVFLLIACGAFLSHSAESYSRIVFLVVWASGTPLMILARQITRHLFADKPWWGVSAIVFGSGAVTRRVLSALRPGNHLGLRIVGVLTSGDTQETSYYGAPVLGDVTFGPIAAAQGMAEYAIIAMPESNSAHLRYAIEEYCVGFRHVLLIPDLPGLSSLDICGRDVGGELGFELPQRLFHISSGVIKRLMDFSVSFTILALFAPLFLLTALLIKLTSSGPVFFGHSRYGRGGRIFKAWKFRTMSANGEAILQRYLMENPSAREEWESDQKLKNDPRVTLIGRWLRKYSFDELPQLWNVLVGDMSLVGPRPIVKAEIVKYGPAYALYQRVIPGITGLWQVSGRNLTTYDERIAFDEYYVRNWSVWLDIYILVRTVRTVLTGHGAY